MGVSVNDFIHPFVGVYGLLPPELRKAALVELCDFVGQTCRESVLESEGWFKGACESALRASLELYREKKPLEWVRVERERLNRALKVWYQAIEREIRNALKVALVDRRAAERGGDKFSQDKIVEFNKGYIAGAREKMGFERWSKAIAELRRIVEASQQLTDNQIQFAIVAIDDAAHIAIPAAKVVYMAICARAIETDRCQLAHSQIAKETGLSVRYVVECARYLQNMQMLEVFAVRGPAGQEANIYRPIRLRDGGVFNGPGDYAEKPCPGKPEYPEGQFKKFKSRGHKREQKRREWLETRARDLEAREEKEKHQELERLRQKEMERALFTVRMQPGAKDLLGGLEAALVKLETPARFESPMKREGREKLIKVGESLRSDLLKVTDFSGVTFEKIQNLVVQWGYEVEALTRVKG